MKWALGSAVLVSGGSHAAQGTSTGDVMVVTGSVMGHSSATDVKDYPGSRTVISAEHMKATASDSIDQALQKVNGIKIQDESGTGVLPNIAVRGLSASRSGQAQFLMDGIPLTLAPYGHTGQSIFPASLANLDRIDIVRGGAAVQYGPNNVGGVINLVTKPIPAVWRTELSQRITKFEGHGTPLNDFYIRTGGWLNQRFALQIAGDFLKGDSFRDHSDTDVKNFQLKTAWLISDTQELDTFIQHYKADTEMAGALSPSDYRQDRHQSKRPDDTYVGETTRWHLKYLHDLDWGNSGRFELLTFGHHSERNFQWGYNSTAAFWADPELDATHVRSSPRTFNVVGVEPKLALSFGSPESVTQHWIIGTRYVNEDISYRLKQTPISGGTTTMPRNWHLETNAYAAYVSNELGLFDQTLTITPGLRYEMVRMNFADRRVHSSQDNDVNELLPGLTLAYKLTAHWTAYANTQRSLRTPQIASIRGRGEKGNELAWNYEVGTRFTEGENQLNLALYRIDFKDQLQWNSTDQTFDNVGKTLHQGVEISGRYAPESIHHLSLGLGYTYLDATYRQGPNKGKRIQYSSKHQLVWDAAYDLAGYTSTLSGFYFSNAYSDAANTRDEDAKGSTGRLPSYTVWNFNVGKDVYQSQNRILRVNVAVNNLFNKDYYFRGIDVSPVGRYPAPGRSYSLDLNYQF
ncbi:TonB-dependent siderophore receptor [Celerinatantimonas sp. YJH-8]